MKKIIKDYLNKEIRFKDSEILVDVYKRLTRTFITITTISKYHINICSYNLTLEQGLDSLTGTASFHDIKIIIALSEYLIKNWSPLK